MVAKWDSTLKEHLRRKQNHEIQFHYLSHKIQNELILLIAAEIKGAVLKRIKEVKYFSVILYCTPDISQWVFEELTNVLHHLGLDIDDVRGQGYDNGSNMKGKHKDSTKRWDILKDNVSEKGYTLKSLSTTRWESRVDSVKTIVTQAPEIREALHQLAEKATDSGIKSEAKCLADYELGKFEFIVGMVIWYHILAKVNIVNKHMQSENMRIDVAMGSVKALIAFFKEYREEGFEKSLNCAKEIAAELDIDHVFPEKKKKTEKLKSLDAVKLKRSCNNLEKKLENGHTSDIDVPVTVASAERSLSKLKILKSYLRSTMSQERLNVLALISIEHEFLEKLDYDRLIDDFASKSARRSIAVEIFRLLVIPFEGNSCGSKLISNSHRSSIGASMEDEGERSSIVVGLIENRAKEVGVAAFDLRSASLHLSQYIETSSSYQNTKTLLNFYDPNVIIVPPNKLAPDGMVGVSELVDKFFPSVRKAVMARGCFDDTKGTVLTKNLAAKDLSVLGLDTYYKQYYLCLAAAAATIKWYSTKRFLSMLLIAYIFDGHRYTMQNAETSCDIKTETEKGVIVTNHSLSPKKVPNEVLSDDHSKRSQVLVASIILLKTALDALPLLSKVLKDAKSFLLENIYHSVCESEKYGSIRKRIGEVIDEDVLHARAPFVARTQQCFAIKAGIDGFLDVARRSFCDTSEAIHNLANKYREDLKIPNLKLPFNNRQGFYIRIPHKDVQGKLPSKFIQIVKHGNNIHCSTLELASLNVRNKSAAGECYARTAMCLEALMDTIREDVGMLTLLAEVLCMLDMIVNSFAHMISTKPVGSYTRPGFTSNGPLAIDAGRHPILESIHSDFVANNVFLSEASNMVIITGPNMSGKSTYLQQVCLTVILAQIGCYVPARFATLRVVDRIFTRMNAPDSLESNSSTFMTEMRETAFIMQNVSSKSLIVVDELGRATSSSDGFAISWSCCEHLLSLKAYTIFATHMENLVELATIYPNVKVLHFYVDVQNKHLDFKFQLKDGARHVPHYGLLLAEVAGLPNSVITAARSITENLTQKEVKRMQVNCMQNQPIQTIYGVAQRLICLKYSSQKEDMIRVALQNLKESYAEGRI
ncbi:unnamed protein product [Rhodiola kirilowii]